VSYHEAFWLATAAAAPVIVLAVVVARPDVDAAAYAALRRSVQPDNVESGNSEKRKIEEQRRGYATHLLLTAITFRSLSTLNVLMQAGLLAVSLSALATGRNIMPPWVAIVLAVAGILLLSEVLRRSAAIRRSMETD
jgi:hypothetical protein